MKYSEVPTSNFKKLNYVKDNLIIKTYNRLDDLEAAGFLIKSFGLHDLCTCSVFASSPAFFFASSVARPFLMVGYTIVTRFYQLSIGIWILVYACIH